MFFLFMVFLAFLPESVVDTRPDFWSKPHGNWAKHYFPGWKIHHTGVNWMRNGEVHMDQWQFSDNRRAYQIKSAKLRVENN